MDNFEAMKNSSLTQAELNRYARHISLPEIAQEGQLQLKNAKVLVIGCGGLGAPLLQYLNAAGVGTIGLMDHDTVDESNLQRQVLFSEHDLGQSKVACAKRILSKQNSNTQLITYPFFIDSENALETIKDFDMVADGSDNFATRYLVNDACVLLNKPLVYGSINQFEGQVSVFNQSLPKGKRSPNYRDLFPTPPPPDKVPTCAEGGVMGVLPGIIGSMQANEVIKLITGIGNTLHGRMFHFNAKTFTSYTLQFETDKNNPLTGDNPTQKGLVDYAHFCGSESVDNDIPTVTPNDLEMWKREQVEFELIDVREMHEFKALNLGGKPIPLSELKDRIEEIDPSKKTVIHCKSGKRSLEAIKIIRKKGDFPHLYNLQVFL